MIKTHSKFIVSLGELVELNNHDKLGECHAEIIGCKSCLIRALGNLLARDPELKDIINKSVRVANEIKGRTQN